MKQIVKNIEDVQNLQENEIIGFPVFMDNSVFEFEGENNILFFDENVELSNTTIRFKGNNNLIFLCSGNGKSLKLKIDTYNDSVFYFGKNNNTTRPLHIVLSERKHCIIGNDCLFSFDIWIRNADPHLIYDAKSHQRINLSKSVFIGNHVWIGQDVLVSKGAMIGSGSIIGAKSLVTGKKYPSNCSIGGVPARVLKTNIFWRKPSAHSFSEEQTKKSYIFKENKYIYDNGGLSFEVIEEQLEKIKKSQDRKVYLEKNMFHFDDKNKFFIPIENKKIRRKLWTNY